MSLEEGHWDSATLDVHTRARSGSRVACAEERSHQIIVRMKILNGAHDCSMSRSSVNALSRM